MVIYLVRPYQEKIILTVTVIDGLIGAWRRSGGSNVTDRRKSDRLAGKDVFNIHGGNERSENRVTQR